MVATVTAEIDDEVVLFADYIDEAIEGTADAFFGGFGIFDEGDMCRVEMVAGGQELDEGFGIANSVVEFGAMLVVVDGDGQQVVGASGGWGSVFLIVMLMHRCSIRHWVWFESKDKYTILIKWRLQMSNICYLGL